MNENFNMINRFLLFLVLLNFISGQLTEIYNNEAVDGQDPIVTIGNGNIQGRIDQTIGQGKAYYIFQGIPFAQPPVDDLRFEPPVPAETWEGLLKTQNYKGDCVQTSNMSPSGDITGSEDCLYINVYTPQLEGNNLTVMVWIYGGAFYAGTSSPDVYGPDYLIDNDVIVVTFNYRLGIFGFLSTGDLVVPGNAGLKDQLLALKWVKRNIENFGGDPDKITLFGQSAGAASVGYHLTSNESNAIFRNSILESGSALGIWTRSRKMKEAVNLVANIFDLDANNSELLVNGLREISARTLHGVSMNVLFTLQGAGRNGIVYSPVVEPPHSGAFFTEKSHQLLVEKQFNSGPVMLGFTSMESLIFSQIVEMFYLTNTTETYDLVPIDLNIENETENEIVYNKIREFYFGTEPVYDQVYQAHKFFSFDQFIRPIIETARLLAKQSKTYLYEFSYVGNLNQFPNCPIPEATHSDELFYIWRKDSNETTATDELVRLRLAKLWTNFAKYNNPTPSEEPLLENITWNESDSIQDNLLYIKLDEQLELGLNPHNAENIFWTNIYKDHGYPPFDTY